MSPFAPSRGGAGSDAGGTGAPTGPGGGGGGAGAGAAPGTPTVAVPGPGQGGARMLGSTMIQVLRLAADRTEYGPPIFVNPQDVVTVVPLRSNVGHVFIATSGNSDAKFPPRFEMLPTDNPIQVYVASLKEIGVYSATPGEGVLIILNRRPA